MKKRKVCLALVLCLFLTACGGEQETQPQSRSFLLGDAAGLQEETILLQVDGRDVPAWRYLYWLARACDMVWAEYERVGEEPDWSAAADTGTLADYVKAQALSDTVLYATVENWGEQFGCAAEIPEDLLLEPDSELGLRTEQVRELETVGILYRELYALFCTEGSALAPDAAALTSYAQEQGWATWDRILIPKGPDAEAARKKAETCFSQLNASGNQEALFTELRDAGADTLGPRTVQLGKGCLHKTLEEALQALQEHQYSGILETDEGFSVLRRLPTDSANVVEAYFDEQLQAAAGQAQVQCAKSYGALNVETFYSALQKIRTEQPHAGSTTPPQA